MTTKEFNDMDGYSILSYINLLEDRVNMLIVDKSFKDILYEINEYAKIEGDIVDDSFRLMSSVLQGSNKVRYTLIYDVER